MIALSIAGTVIVLRSDSNGGDGPTQSAQGSDSEFASANDTGPATVITDDVTCDAWTRIGREYADTVKSVNWDDRDRTVSVGAWTPEQRTMYETVGKAMTRAAEQTVGLMKRTPHRVMRELYEQFIAYAHAFTNVIPKYVADDDNFVVVTEAAGNSVSNICSAINYKSAQTISGTIADPAPPSKIATLGDAPNPEVFLPEVNPICSEWASMVSRYSDDTAAWVALDPNIEAKAWTPEQRGIIDAVTTVMTTNADDIEKLGRNSGNPTLEDFAVLGAQYRRAYAAALPTYTPRDSFLAESATYLVKIVDWACKAGS
ncbi:hypothetical protein M1247_00165 [Mycobacterium sp. 21AC1]|uniref:hypothetical protein n=1 Tax=[Mycobacterium] appelbergii TaxID=2939269 RepID=UPI0029393B40|nr:hypothetical protein [Mycobacterium sp. 21AC1]MDV3123315.1 hypothetical protein [Mycobacterium sp. 21AC1]